MSIHSYRKFDLNNIQDDATICIIGKRNTGKSYLMRDIFYHKQYFRKGLVISGTERYNHFFSRFIPPRLIKFAYNENDINQILKVQGNKIAKEGKTKGNSAFLFMDDVLSSKKDWVNSTAISKLFNDGRHYNILYAIALQNVMGIPPHLRTQVDYCFFFYTNILAEQRKIFEYYCGMFETFADFKKVFDKLTEGFKCLVLDTRSRGNASECIFWYEAEPRDNFTVCAPKFWID